MQSIFDIIVLRDTGTWCNAIYQAWFDSVLLMGYIDIVHFELNFVCSINLNYNG